MHTLLPTPAGPVVFSHRLGSTTLLFLGSGAVHCCYAVMQIYLAVLVAVVTISEREGIRSEWQGHPITSGDGAQDSNYTRVTCDFEDDSKGLCGWENIAEGYDMTWTRAFFDKNNNHYAHLDVANYGRYDKGGLASPWLEAKPCHTCRLQFRYYIQRDNRCQLSLIHQTAETEQVLWSTTRASKSPFSGPQVVQIRCSQDRYRMLFEGEKLHGRRWHCGGDWDEIDVDDIVYDWYPDQNCKSTTTHSTATALPQTTSTSSSDRTTSASLPVITSVISVPAAGTSTQMSVPDNDSMAQPHGRLSSDGLDTGPLAGIIIAVIVVIVVVVVVVVVVARRGHYGGDAARKHSKASSSPPSVSRAVTNSAYMSHDQGPDDPYATLSDDKNTPNRGYELTALPCNSNGAGASRHAGSSNYYTRLHVKRWEGATLSSRTADNTSDLAQAQQGSDFPALPDEYAVPHAERKSKPSDAATRTAAGKNTAAKGETDCKKAAATSSAAYENIVAEDYDHLRPLADWKQGGANDYSLARNDYSLASNVGCSTPAEAAVVDAPAETTDYEAVDDDGSLVMSPSGDVSNRLVTSPSANSGNVYSRLNTKGGPAVGQDVYQNRYDHINDPAGTSAMYNRLHQKERARDQQRDMAADEYSHI